MAPTACTDSPIWQLPTFPSVPEYRRLTPGEPRLHPDLRRHALCYRACHQPRIPQTDGQELPQALIDGLVTEPALAQDRRGSGPWSSARTSVHQCGGTPSALQYAVAHAWLDFGGEPVGERCEGPFGNERGKTQWACYGRANGFHWQVNVGPYGEQTYARKY